MAEMIMASFLQIWHLIPIVIAVILFKKFLNNKDKKRRIEKNEQFEKEGLTLEIRTAKKYEEMGYKVEHKKSEDKKGIDLLCSKDDKTLLIQCKNDIESKSITSDDVKAFINSAINYVKLNNMENKGVEFRYAVLYPEVLDKSAIKVLSDDSSNCKYIVL